MKKVLVTALACLFVTTAVAGCSDDAAGLPGISTGTAPASFSGASLASLVEGFCGTSCDGDLADQGLPAFESDNDRTALFELVMLGWSGWLDGEDVGDTDTYMNVIDTLGEDPVELTFNITRTTNCNSTDTMGEGLGDATDGTISETFIVTGMFDSSGDVTGSDWDYTRIVGFNNCLISGDLLNEVMAGSVKGMGDGSAIRLNGGWVMREHDPDTASMANPYHAELAGKVLLSGDQNGDGTFDDPFWTHVVNLDAEVEYDGSDSWENGGGCAGEAVSLDGDDMDNEGDNCAADTDSKTDAWFSAGWFFF
ncbi:MAG: hypothetical protein KDH09_20065 [Chrysiogenetes bacterium]|nr:hypothetical protein [Chrysiogenetes bacterium]